MKFISAGLMLIVISIFCSGQLRAEKIEVVKKSIVAAESTHLLKSNEIQMLCEKDGAVKGLWKEEIYLAGIFAFILLFITVRKIA